MIKCSEEEIFSENASVTDSYLKQQMKTPILAALEFINFLTEIFYLLLVHEFPEDINIIQLACFLQGMNVSHTVLQVDFGQGKAEVKLDKIH